MECWFNWVEKKNHTLRVINVHVMYCSFDTIMIFNPFIDQAFHQVLLILEIWYGKNLWVQALSYMESKDEVHVHK
jgi:hypothetical protein